MFGAVDAVCAEIGDDATVLVVDPLARLTLLPSLRGVCDVPAAHLLPSIADDPPSSVDAARRRASELGLDLVLVATDPVSLAPFESVGTTTISAVSLPVTSRELERTLLGPPDRYMADDEQFFLPRDMTVYVLRFDGARA